jgi:hypothetical protein
MDAPEDSVDPNGPRGAQLDGSFDATANLKRTLSAVASGRASRRDFEGAATRLVAQLRSERHAPEQMLLRIKEVLAEAGLRPTYASSEHSHDGDDGKLYRDVITWCIHCYYDPPPAQE